MDWALANGAPLTAATVSEMVETFEKSWPSMLTNGVDN